MAIKKFFLKKGMIDFYLKYKSIRKTADKYNYNRATMRRLLISANVDTSLDKEKQRQKLKKYKIDDNFFAKVDTRDKAYILGIIFSDGHLYKNRKQLRIKLTDIDLLTKINKRITNKPLLNVKKQGLMKKEARHMIICNGIIYDDLIKLGMKQNKTYTNEFPELPKKFISDFIRGFFDGNGWIHLAKRNDKIIAADVGLMSTVSFCKILKKHLDSKCIHSYIEVRKNKCDERIATLRIRRMISAINFFHFIYDDLRGQIYLKRKLEKYKIFTKIYDNGDLHFKRRCL